MERSISSFTGGIAEPKTFHNTNYCFKKTKKTNTIKYIQVSSNIHESNELPKKTCWASHSFPTFVLRPSTNQSAVSRACEAQHLPARGPSLEAIMAPLSPDLEAINPLHVLFSFNQESTPVVILQKFRFNGLVTLFFHNCQWKKGLNIL